MTQIEEKKKEHDALAKSMSMKIRTLMDISKVSNELLAKEIGMGVQTIANIRSANQTPTLTSLIKMADYFAVPLDYFCGRMGETDECDMLSDYYSYFMDIRCARFEARLAEGTTFENIYDIPWPYNLYFDIFKRPIVQPLDEDQKNKIVKAISELNEREQAIIYSRYRNGMTFHEIGVEYDITRERARQNCMKAMYKLIRAERRRSMKK